MNNSKEEKFRKRFGDRINCVYQDKPIDVEEQRFHNNNINAACIAIMADVLKRKHTSEEIFGIVPIKFKAKYKESDQK
jgi:hypothetical protein